MLSSISITSYCVCRGDQIAGHVGGLTRGDRGNDVMLMTACGRIAPVAAVRFESIE